MAKVLCVLYDDPVTGYPKNYARNDTRGGLRDHAPTENTDLSNSAEEHDKADRLQKKDAVTRRERFLVDRSPCLESACQPVGAKNDPRN